MKKVFGVVLGLAVILAAGSSAFAGLHGNRRTIFSEEQTADLKARTEPVDTGIYGKATNEQLWDLVAPSTIQRYWYIDPDAKGCPRQGCGGKLVLADPLNHPLQVQCVKCGTWYPNEKFPDPDGAGYDMPDGSRLRFTAGAAFRQFARHATEKALPLLSCAYVQTGDRRYATKAAVLLTRIAQQMPNSTDKRNRCWGSYAGSSHRRRRTLGTYGKGSGLYVCKIGGAGYARYIIEAYDLIRDGIDGNAELIAFLQNKIPELDEGPKIREYINENLFRVYAQALLDEVLASNPGIVQILYAQLAAVLDDFGGKKRPNSKDMLEALYYGKPEYRFFFSNFVSPDGGGIENPEYHGTVLMLLRAAAVLDRYRALTGDSIPWERYPPMSEHPHARKVVDFMINVQDQGHFRVDLGDAHNDVTGRLRKPHWRATTSPAAMAITNYHCAFHVFNDPDYARVLVEDDGKVWEREPIWSGDHNALRAAAAKSDLTLHRKTMLFDETGIAFLRGGPPDHPRTVWINYGVGQWHDHLDPLHIGLVANQRNLLPGVGYWASLHERGWWEKDIWAHNTAIVDDGYPMLPHGLARYTYNFSSPHGEIERMHDFRDSTDALGVQTVQISIPVDSLRRPEAPSIPLYRRTLALVDVSPEQFYVLDVFEVTGGREHHLGYHFCDHRGNIETTGVALRSRPGTLAGEDVPFGTYITKTEGTRLSEWAGSKELLDVRSCMTGISRGPAAEPYTVLWRPKKHPAVQMRVTTVPDAGTEAILVKEYRHHKRASRKLPFTFARRAGAAPLKSRYVTILEACKGAPCVNRVERIQVDGNADALAVRVETDAGVDVFVLNGEGGVTVSSENIKTDAALAIASNRGKALAGYMSGGTRLAVGKRTARVTVPALRAPILALDRKANEVAVKLPGALSLKGRWIRIENGERNRCYRVVEQKEDAQGRTVLALDRGSLLGEGQVTGVRQGVVLNDVRLPQGGYSESKSVVYSRALSGAWIECNGRRYRVENVEGGPYTRKRSNWNVHLDAAYGDTSPARLSEAFPNGTVFAIYDYAPGDTVTVVSEGRIGLPGTQYTN